MKQKYFLSLLFLIVLCGNALAQRQREYFDSLHRLLVQEQSDTGKLRLFNVLAVGYSETESDSSLHYAQEALRLAQKIGDTNGEIAAYLRITYAYSLKGNHLKALETAFENLQRAEKAKDTVNILFTLLEICRTYLRTKDYAATLVYARKMKSLALSPYFKDHKDLKGVYGNWMGHAFENLNQLDSAFYYRQLSYQIALSSHSSGSLAIATNSLARFYFRTGDNELAFSFYRKALRYAEEAKRYIFVAHAYLGMAKLFEKKGGMDSALHYGKLALNLYQGMKSATGELVDAASLLNELYAGAHRTDSAYKYLAMAVALKDSVFSQDKERQIQSLQFNEILRLRQEEQQRKEAQQQYETRLRIYVLLGALAVLVIIAFILYRNNKQKQNANLLLHQKNEEIHNALSELKSTQAQLIQSEKMASLGELTAGIAHEIQNPLNFVNNFSEVNEELVKELKSEATKGHLEEVKTIANDIAFNAEKITHHGKRADALVKGMLQHSRSSSGIKELTDINALCDEYLRLAYHGLRAKDKSFNVTTKTEFDNSIGKINIIPQDMGKVILNLINNAFYAVDEKKKSPHLLKGSEEYEPVVTITTKRLGSPLGDGGKIEIKVADNGNGIPQKVFDKIFQPFFTTKPTGQGTGLGLSLSYDIVKAHGGEFKVETKEGEGSEFIILLPVI